MGKQDLEDKDLAEKKNDMKILLVGGGGREHAIADAIIRSPRTAKLYCAPGNAGIAGIAECVPIGTMDFPALGFRARSGQGRPHL